MINGCKGNISNIQVASLKAYENHEPSIPKNISNQKVILFTLLLPVEAGKVDAFSAAVTDGFG